MIYKACCLDKKYRGHRINQNRRRRISLLANIPALALSEQALYGFVWYVHPYPRTQLGFKHSEVSNFSYERKLSAKRERVQFRGRTPPEKKKDRGHRINQNLRRRISLSANIPSLALSERAHYCFVWYVHPYPRTSFGYT